MSTHLSIERLRGLTLGNFIQERASQNADRIALEYLPDGRSFSYGDVYQESGRYAAGLRTIGVHRGCHVALMLENSPEFLFLLIALARLGAVSVPLAPSLRGDLLSYFLRHSDAKVLITDPSISAIPDVDFLRVRQLESIVTFGKDGRGDDLFGGLARHFALEDLRVQNPEERASEAEYNDLAMLMYTSGTTGPSKANMFSQAHALQYAIEQARAYGYKREDAIYTCLPISHANGLLSSTYGAFAANCRVALTRKFSVSRFWPEIRASGATVVGLLGSMTEFLWNAPRSDDDTNHSIRTVIMIPVPQYGADFARRFNVSLLSSYGLTDYALATIYSPSDPPQKLGSAGRPRPGMQVRIVDEHDLDVPAGQLGEIVLRSDNMWATSSGYYKMPAETVACSRNFWFHTGDRGYLDEDGFLFFVDRKKDAIRRRGENVSAFEVERTLQSHPLVLEAAVFAVKSEASEDEIAACVVIAQGAKLSPDELAQHCTKHLAKFMVPRFIRFVVELPKNASQKVEKYKLRAEAEADRTAFWDRERAESNAARQ